MTRKAESRNRFGGGWWIWLTAAAFLGCLVGLQAVRADDDGKVYGTISSLPATQGWLGDWTVSGKTIRVTAATKINQNSGPPTVGVYVEVQGTRVNDNLIQATQIETKLGGGGGPQVDLQGNVEALPNTSGFIGNWTVNGKTVRVATTTYLKQDNAPVAIGVLVEVKGNQQSDGSIAASIVDSE